uniref:Uncharacterized protein CZA382.08 n=1 Tax=Amycolatopsis orientalis TaxID=31958 RepID=Q9XBE3_AMYOR|nr:hypothetical protein [Amycolatopsis orientalis]
MGPDAQRPELVEGERAIRETLDHLLDPVELGVPVRVGGFLPGLGALEGDAAASEQTPQRLTADLDQPAGGGAQVGGEFADRPAREGAGRVSPGGWWPSPRRDRPGQDRVGGDGLPPTEGPDRPDRSH